MADTKNAAEATISKNEAVRRALAELGNEATRVQIQDFVKDHFGFEMTANHISAAKAAALARMSKKKKRGRPKGSTNKNKALKAAAAEAGAPQAAKPAPAGNGKVSLNLDEIRTLKALVKRVGASDLRNLIDVLS